MPTPLHQKKMSNFETFLCDAKYWKLDLVRPESAARRPWHSCSCGQKWCHALPASCPTLFHPPCFRVNEVGGDSWSQILTIGLPTVSWGMVCKVEMMNSIHCINAGHGWAKICRSKCTGVTHEVQGWVQMGWYQLQSHSHVNLTNCLWEHARTSS